MSAALCLMAGGLMLALPPDGHFRLQWTHSVEKTEWREDWRRVPGGLKLERAAIKGSGAGMEPGPDARLVDGWLVWSPKVAPVSTLVIAASGMTASGWTLCASETCQVLGDTAGEAITLRPCQN
ncbi:DUF1850 domain-containing protein (plasmid) [Agrobacterium tumefaciens]|nr:DUF1850 domain-containing protein [Agrobacterium tumefaciens]CUX67579.1 conserved hypothetical protein [Agrobacterium genomosp. 5 str. CFBP 6626]